MASLEERLNQAKKEIEELKKKVFSQLKYHSEQIEMILSRAQRTLQRDEFEKAPGYGGEIKHHAEQIDEIFDGIADVVKQAKAAEGDSDSEQDIFGDSLKSLEDALKDFKKEHKLANEEDPMRMVVRRTMSKLKSS